MSKNGNIKRRYWLAAKIHRKLWKSDNPWRHTTVMQWRTRICFQELSKLIKNYFIYSRVSQQNHTIHTLLIVSKLQNHGQNVEIQFGASKYERKNLFWCGFSSLVTSSNHGDPIWRFKLLSATFSCFECSQITVGNVTLPKASHIIMYVDL